MTKLTAANQKPLMPKLCDFKTCSDQILAKLVDQGVAAAVFLSRHPAKIYKMKKFPLPGNC